MKYFKIIRSSETLCHVPPKIVNEKVEIYIVHLALEPSGIQFHPMRENFPHSIVEYGCIHFIIWNP